MPIFLPDESSGDHIYTGFWVNQAFGPFRGACLTLSHQAGGLLIAFLALFIGAASRSAWKIICFLLHAAYATPVSQDGLYQQRQILLRNNSLPITTAISMLRASMAWRNRAAEVKQRTLSVAVAALTFSMITAAAGILSSKLLTSSTSEVLVASQLCGELPVYNATEYGFAEILSMVPHISQIVLESSTYATQCYGQQTGACDAFVTPTLPYLVNRNASCPFQDGICKSTNNNLLLDTGPIDSLRHLGLNDGPRFSLEQRIQCAPLKTEGFTTTVSNKSDSRDRVFYSYGPNAYENYTFGMDLLPPDFFLDSLNTPKGDYSVTSASFPMNSSEIIDELYQPYAEVTLHLLDASQVIYAQSTQDPWFSATTPIQDDGGLGESFGGVASQMYSSDAPANVLGCVTERFYCNPSLPSSVGCIDSFGYIRGSNRTYRTNEEDAVPSIWPDAKEQSVMRPLLSTLGMGVSLDNLHVIPTSPTLLARRTLFGNLQMEQLPLDQWKIEQEHLFKVSLAQTQSMMVDFAKGFWIGVGVFCELEDKNLCYRGCHSQKIRSSKFYSFSAWSLALIFLVGTLTMLIAVFLENIITLILRIPWLSFSRLAYAHAEWKAESTLQLHRLAHENLGLGRWTKTDEVIPVTHVGDTLAMLDVRDTKHARMVAPSEELEHLTSPPTNINVRMRAKYERVPSSVQL